jgi:hypothetical protein
MRTHSSEQPAERQESRREFLRKTAYVGVAALIPTTLSAQNPVGDIYGEGLPACRVAYPTATPAYALDNALAETFRELSESLTGVGALDAHLNKAYLVRVATNPELTSAVPPLLDAFRQLRRQPKENWEGLIDATIMKNPQLRPCAEQVIYLWYFSAFFLPDPADKNPDPAKRKRIWVYGDYAHYSRGLVWSLIGAHAPAVAGGPYGYWADTVTL